MRPGLSSSFAALLAVAVATTPAVAQNLITLSPELVAAAMPDAEKDKLQPEDKDLKLFKDRVKDQGPTAVVRPNAPAAGVFFVYALNADAKNRTLIVSLRNAADGQLLGEGRAENVPGRHWSVIRFAKPAAAAPPAPAPVDPKAAPVEPPPPGVATARGTDGFALTAKLYDEDPKTPGVRREVVQGNNPAEVELPVKFAPAAISQQDDATKYPATAVRVGDLSFKSGVATIPLTALPAAKSGQTTARVTFPGQPNGGPPPGVTGVFALTLDPAAKEVPLGGKFTKNPVPMHLAIDGIERVRVYEPGTGSDVKAVDAQRVRVIPVGRTVTADLFTKPTAAFAVRVETDNGVSTDALRLELSGDTTKQTIALGGPRDERLWVDVAEPTKQGLGFATKTTDWVKAVDLSAARGRVTLKAVLKGTGEVTDSLSLLIDADPPAVSGLTVGDSAKASEKVAKGKTVKVKATAKDADGSGVEKVTFVLYAKLQDDGTLPADAVKVEGVRRKELDKDKKSVDTDEWVADFPVPADKKGQFFIAAVAADKAGNDTKVGKADPDLPANVKELVLVDAPPAAPVVPRGSISGIVIFAGRPQPGLPIVVGGGDGKAKAVVFTNDAGKFCIPDVVPGVYTVLTAKTDSNKGFQSQADVTVEPEKTAKVTLELIRNK